MIKKVPVKPCDKPDCKRQAKFTTSPMLYCPSKNLCAEHAAEMFEMNDITLEGLK